MTNGVIVRSREYGDYQQEIIAGDHYFYADEPLDVGGDDSAPDPYALLLGALGACTSITIQMYAKRKNYPLEAVEVELTHGSDYRTDCEACGDKPIKFAKITRKLTFRGDLSDQQKTRLAEIAKKCPVHQTLLGEIEVTDL